LLRQRLGRKEVHLGDWFDLIGGTSTGAIIAGALALGYTIEDVKRFYLELAPRVFKRPFWRIIGLQAKFDARALREEIKSIVGDCTLDSEKLITGLCVVTKRMDTGRPSILAPNHHAPHWETLADDRPTGTKVHRVKQYYAPVHLDLASLVRASTTASFYFDPEWLPIVKGEKDGLFVDGGVTPHNNPSLVLFLMTILKPFGLCWESGPDKLTVVSIGTGSHRDRLVPDELGMGKTTRLAIHALTSLMSDIQTFVLMQMQYLGQCLTPWWINSEVGTLAEDGPPQGKMFRFLPYDVRLELLKVMTELLQAEEKVDRAVRTKIRSQKREISEGTEEWELLHKRYYAEELKKLGIDMSR
jgi:hypothetical protein